MLTRAVTQEPLVDPFSNSAVQGCGQSFLRQFLLGPTDMFQLTQPFSAGATIAPVPSPAAVRPPRGHGHHLVEELLVIANLSSIHEACRR